MTEEIKEILNEIKIVIDYNEIQNIYRTANLDYNDGKLLLNYITNLQKENENLKEELNDISYISYKDYNVWLTERRYLNTLEDFANDIKYKIAPNLTDGYRDGIKNSIKHLIRYVKDNYKQDTLLDYKQRNEKAVEYIKSKKAIINTDYIRIFDLFEIEEQGYTKDLLNILKGGDE